MEPIIRHLAAFSLFLLLLAPYPAMLWAVDLWRTKHPRKEQPPRKFIDRPDHWWGDAWEWLESQARWYASADWLFFLPYVLYSLFCLFGAYVLRVDIMGIMGVAPPPDPPAFPSHLRGGWPN